MEAAWGFSARLPWPAMRGQALWTRFTSGDAAPTAGAGAGNSGASSSTQPRAAAALPLEIELCTPTAGHIALVLRQPHLPASAPRVVFVVDAVPPKRMQTRARPFLSTLKEPSWNPITTRAHSFAGTSSAAPPTSPRTPQQQDTDEMALIEELFTCSPEDYPDCPEGQVLAKPPLLCARFETPVAAVRFVRSPGATPKDTAILRCLVASADGQCALWEWGADLHQWTYLNRFSVLEMAPQDDERALLRSVRELVVFDCAWSRGDDVRTLELAWIQNTAVGGREEEDETAASSSTLWLRKIQFGIEKSTFRTEMGLGAAFQMPQCDDVQWIASSKLGLWALSKAGGVLFRSIDALETAACEWHDFGDADAESSATTPDMLATVHNVTGELVLVNRRAAVAFVVAPASLGQARSTSGLRVKQLVLHLPALQDRSGDAIDEIAAHRHLLVLLMRTRCVVASLLTGKQLANMAAPPTSSTASPPSHWSLWTIAGKASAVGIWSPTSFRQLQTPAVSAIARHHLHKQQQPASALQAAKPYGASQQFDAAEIALGILQSAQKLLHTEHHLAWETATQAVSSPALLLSTLASTAPTYDTLLRELARLVASLHGICYDVLVTGRFAATLEACDAETARSTQYLTPANLESLQHLANWVALAQRKLAALPTMEHATASASASTAAAAATASELDRLPGTPSCLQFAAATTSLERGPALLSQLERLLLRDVHLARGTPRRMGVPSHLLFHEERSVEDFQGALSAFSKHMYFEALCRLLLLHRPLALVPFVKCVSASCPRIFDLQQAQARRGRRPRPHAERALTLLPPLGWLVERLRSTDQPSRELARASLLAYADLLCLGGFHIEACHALLEADLFEPCLQRFIVESSVFSSASHEVPVNSAPSETSHEDVPRQHVQREVFMALLRHCVRHRDVQALDDLITRMPSHVSALIALRSLRKLLQEQAPAGASIQQVTVGQLRPALSKLLRLHLHRQPTHARPTSESA